MRSTSLRAREALFAQSTDEAFLLVLTIDHPDLDPPIRVTSDAVKTVRLNRVIRPGPGTYFNAAGQLQEAAADTPRYTHDLADPTAAPVLLDEEEATNAVRNSRAVGVVDGTAGAGGAWPTFWQAMPVDGVACEVSAVTLNGISGVRARWHGTNTSGAPQMLGVYVDDPTLIDATAGEIWATSFFYRVLGGDVTALSWRGSVREMTAEGDLVAEATYPLDNAVMVTRAGMVATLQGAETERVGLLVYCEIPDGASTDVDLWVGGPQIERDRISSLILTADGPATRPDETVVWDEHIPYPFDITLPAEKDGELPRVTLRIDNVDREIVRTIRTIRSAPTLTMMVVLGSDPNSVEAGPFEFTLLEARYDALVVEGTLGAEDILDEPFPYLTYTPRTAPGMF